MRARIVGLLFALVGLVAAAAPARAQGYGPGTYQPPPPPPPGVIRSGFIAGVAVGGGAFGVSECDECDKYGGFTLRGHLGGMLGPTIALMFDLESTTGPLTDDIVVSHTTAMAVLRVWPARIFWLQGGLGAGWLRFSTEDNAFQVNSEAGGAASIGAGLELMQRPSFTIDLQLRLTASRFAEAGPDGTTIAGGTLLVGFNWY